MTNTYNEDDPWIVKMVEEMRLIRCILERFLQREDGSLFVDYEMEKFGGGKRV